MITAVDTNVLLDVFAADPEHGPTSRAALGRCLEEGLVLACEVVWAEVTAAFPSAERAQDTLLTAGVTFTPMNAEAASMAGAAWRQYRSAGGPRTRVIADFLIGAHASAATDRLLTRDRGFYRSHFEGLEVIDPSAGQPPR